VLFVVNRFPVEKVAVSEASVQQRLEDQWQLMDNEGSPSQAFVEKMGPKIRQMLLKDHQRALQQNFTVDKASLCFRDSGLAFLQQIHAQGHVLGWHVLPDSVGGQSSASEILLKVQAIASVSNRDRASFGSYIKHENVQWLSKRLAEFAQRQGTLLQQPRPE